MRELPVTVAVFRSVKRRSVRFVRLFKTAVILGRHNAFSFYRKKLVFRKWISTAEPRYAFFSFNAEGPRTIEIRESDKRIHEAVISCYFTRKVDPIKGILRGKPDFEYIRPWYESIHRQKLNGIIVHDGLSDHFIQRHTTDLIVFRRYSPGNYSIFEERWFAYYQLLKNLNLRKVFFTDINDVIVKANPFEFAADFERLYIGRDAANRIMDSGWLMNELEAFQFDSGMEIPAAFKFQPAYNAGIVGGSAALMKAFISDVVNLTLLTDTSRHKDMTLVNLVIHARFPNRINFNTSPGKLVDPETDSSTSGRHLFTGYPLNSAFGKYDFSSDAVFIHK